MNGEGSSAVTEIQMLRLEAAGDALVAHICRRQGGQPCPTDSPRAPGTGGRRDRA